MHVEKWLLVSCRQTAFLCGTLALFDSPLVASDWYKVSEHPVGGIALVDRETVVRRAHHVTLWMKIVFPKPQADGASSMVSNTIFDCDARTMDLIYYTRIDESGATISAKPVTQRRVDPIPPDTIAASAFKWACTPRVC